VVKGRGQEEHRYAPVIGNLNGPRTNVQFYIRRQLHPRKPIPESILPEMIVIAGHKMPLNTAE
jgi:hypothetical protein